MSVWAALLVATAGCYAVKLAGLSVPPGLLAHPVAERVADLLPTVLLSALVAVQVFGSGSALVVDARVVGLAVGVVALLLRAPFLVVVPAAAFAAAGFRLLA